jgi:hypothetical protein
MWERAVADRGAMTAAISPASADNDSFAPEPAWSVSDFEALSEEEAVSLLLRRFRKLISLGYDPGRALIDATHVEIALR